MVTALCNINLDVQKGDFVSIMGPSGSGKSTLMNILGCLDQQSKGDFLLNGIDVKTLTADRKAELRGKLIGFVFQSFFLLPGMNAFENIELPLIYAGIGERDRRNRVFELAELVGLTNRLSHLPCELSGGQCQRVAIARALVNHPGLILADEPTGNLDSKTSFEILDILNSLNQNGVTIILITHEAEIARRGKKLMHLKDGKLYEMHRENQYDVI